MTRVNMRYGTIAGIDKEIPRLIQGGVKLDTEQQDAVNQLLDEVYAKGCNAVETARTYGGGDSERALGNWIKSRGVRDKFVIITKGGKSGAGEPLLNAEGILSDLEESLNALQTNYIDLYMLHRDDTSVPAGSIVEVLNQPLKAGKIKAIGGSNWSHQRIGEANEYARKNRLIPMSASSPHFSLAEQFMVPWLGCISIAGPKGKEARDFYAATQLPVIFWSSLAGGFFSGRFQRDNLDTFNQYWDRSCVDTYCKEPNFQRLDRAQELAARKGVSIPQIAIAYVLSQPMNAFCLLSCANGNELNDNLGAFEVELSREETQWLDLTSGKKP
ncbi:MAG TPA: aldo/keto reductase [Polyangiaceae bacterium]|jgi:aryl-alcohol dehydrogenase-like predicted oxidoreductase